MTAVTLPIKRIHQSQTNILLLSLLLVLILVRVPFFFTHHIQEDAYIHFQHARSLTQTGVFGFNPGERVSGSTSPLYTVLIAPVFALFGDRGIPVILLLNGLLFNVAALLIAWGVCPDGLRKRRLLIAVFISLTPAGLVASYSGMETSLLILLFAILLFGYMYEAGAKYSPFALLLLPWTRIDSAAFVALYLLALCFKSRRRACLEGLVYGGSLLAMLVTFQIYFGDPLPQTVRAKAVAYNIEQVTLGTRLNNTMEALARVLMPVNSKYLYRVELVWVVALVVVIGLARVAVLAQA